MSQENLHGDEELQRSEIALLIIDVINDLEFPEGRDLLKYALPMARQIAALRQRAEAAEVPVIYANDNFGRWRSDFQSQIQHCLHDGVAGQPLAELLQPRADHYFVLKPRHSAFFSTTLDLLLTHLGVRRLILTGLAGNICVNFTASDAYLREYEVIVPCDCLASNTAADNEASLEQMRRVLKADISPSDDWTVERLQAARSSASSEA